MGRGGFLRPGPPGGREGPHAGWGRGGMGRGGAARTRFSTAARSRNFCAASSSSRSARGNGGEAPGSEGPPPPPPQSPQPDPRPRVLPGDTVFSRMVMSSMAEVTAAGTPPKTTARPLGRRLQLGMGVGGRVGREGGVGGGGHHKPIHRLPLGRRSGSPSSHSSSFRPPNVLGGSSCSSGGGGGTPGAAQSAAGAQAAEGERKGGSK